MASATLGLGGHGLMIAPACPCRVVIADGALVIAHGDHAVARIIPGRLSASAKPTWESAALAQFGIDGPILALADGIAFDAVFLNLDVGLGEAPWCVMGPGFIHDLPPGIVVMSAAPDEENPFYELHLEDSRGEELIVFRITEQPASAVEFRAQPNQRVLAQSVFEVPDDDGSIRHIAYTELGYEHDNVPWRQYMIAAPLLASTTVVFMAQARMRHANRIFDAAKIIVATLAPLA